MAIRQARRPVFLFCSIIVDTRRAFTSRRVDVYRMGSLDHSKPSRTQRETPRARAKSPRRTSAVGWRANMRAILRMKVAARLFAPSATTIGAQHQPQRSSGRSRGDRRPLAVYAAVISISSCNCALFVCDMRASTSSSLSVDGDDRRLRRRRRRRRSSRSGNKHADRVYFAFSNAAAARCSGVVYGHGEGRRRCKTKKTKKAQSACSTFLAPMSADHR